MSFAGLSWQFVVLLSVASICVTAIVIANILCPYVEEDGE